MISENGYLYAENDPANRIYSAGSESVKFNLGSTWRASKDIASRALSSLNKEIKEINEELKKAKEEREKNRIEEKENSLVTEVAEAQDKYQDTTEKIKWLLRKKADLVNAKTSAQALVKGAEEEIQKQLGEYHVRVAEKNAKEQAYLSALEAEKNRLEDEEKAKLEAEKKEEIFTEEIEEVNEDKKEGEIKIEDKIEEKTEDIKIETEQIEEVNETVEVQVKEDIVEEVIVTEPVETEIKTEEDKTIIQEVKDAVISFFVGEKAYAACPYTAHNFYAYLSKANRYVQDKNEVRALQVFLNEYASYGLVIDGDFGPASESAVINFQGRNGLVADGIVGANTNTKINQIIASCTVQPPTINYFNANPSTIDSGNYSALSWSVTNATTISISSIGSVSASGSQNVYPSTTTTYTLTATGAGGTRTQNVMVTVNTVRPFPPTSCAGVTFSTTLRNGMSSRQDIRCMQGMLNHSNLNLGINPPLVEDGNFGSATEAGVRKFQTKYGFTADGIVGSQTYAKLNELIGVVTPPPVINSFSANPSTINSGGSSALSWSVANAD
ncbi:MAG: peptidoglycan-binding protein, partial [Patescibacteria group bacterium]